jgi:pilus assembly protein Flp/PilA
MLKKLKYHFSRLLNDERGASAIEYGLIAALIAAAIIGAVTGIGEQVHSTFVTICTGLGGTCT